MTAPTSADIRKPSLTDIIRTNNHQSENKYMILNRKAKNDVITPVVYCMYHHHPSILSTNRSQVVVKI